MILSLILIINQLVQSFSKNPKEFTKDSEKIDYVLQLQTQCFQTGLMTSHLIAINCIGLDFSVIKYNQFKLCFSSCENIKQDQQLKSCFNSCVLKNFKSFELLSIFDQHLKSKTYGECSNWPFKNIQSNYQTNIKLNVTNNQFINYMNSFFSYYFPLGTLYPIMKKFDHHLGGDIIFHTGLDKTSHLDDIYVLGRNKSSYFEVSYPSSFNKIDFILFLNQNNTKINNFTSSNDFCKHDHNILNQGNNNNTSNQGINNNNSNQGNDNNPDQGVNNNINNNNNNNNTSQGNINQFNHLFWINLISIIFI